MYKHKIFYEKIKLSDLNIEIPENRKLYITKNNEIYFIKNKKKIIINKIKNIIPDFNIYGINYSAVIKNNNIIITLIINLKIIDKLFNEPIKIKYRKKTIMLFKKCIEQAKKEYINSIYLDIINSIDKSYNYIDNIPFQFHKGNLEWMSQKEFESKKINYVLSNDYLKIGSNFINVRTGKFYKTIKKIPIRFRGGILINNVDNYWIYDMLNINNISIKYKCRLDYINTKGTLIIISDNFIPEWKDKINNINNNKNKVFIINNKNSHSKIKYEDLINSTYVIVSIEYLLSEDYKNIINDYTLSDNISLSSIYDCMRHDYVKCKKKIKKYTKPILSLFYWNRLIIDNDVFNKMYDNEYIYDMIFTIESFYKWIQLKKIPNDIEKLKLCINYLIKYKNINLPIYDENYNLIFLKDIIRFNLNPCNINPIKIGIKEIKIYVNMSQYEQTIYNYFIEHSNKKINKNINTLLIDTVNEMSINSIKYKNNFNYKNCCICYVSLNINNCVITKCNHQLCLKCTLESMRFTSNCCMCRMNLKPYDYHKIVKNESSKFEILKNIISTKKKTVIIFNKDLIGNILLLNYDGYYLKKEQKNIIQTKKLIFLKMDDIYLLNEHNNIESIIFYDIPSDYAKNIIINPKIYKNIRKTEIKYIIYKDTKEEKIFKN